MHSSFPEKSQCQIHLFMQRVFLGKLGQRRYATPVHRQYCSAGGNTIVPSSRCSTIGKQLKVPALVSEVGRGFLGDMFWLSYFRSFPITCLDWFGWLWAPRRNEHSGRHIPFHSSQGHFPALQVLVRRECSPQSVFPPLSSVRVML